MKINTISTGSKGNCYVIEWNNKYIILDAGLPFETITSNKYFPKFKDIEFVFISHEHHDHNKAIKDFEKSGCDMLTYEMLENKIQDWKFGDFNIITFPVRHNVNNYGIIIADGKEKLCYVTDFFATPNVEGIDHWLYEVNYVEAAINSMIEKDKEFKHTNFKYHNSLEKAKAYFKSLQTRPKSITICHLSKDNANAEQILKAMKPFADKVTIAGGEENGKRK